MMQPYLNPEISASTERLQEEARFFLQKIKDNILLDQDFLCIFDQNLHPIHLDIEKITKIAALGKKARDDYVTASLSTLKKICLLGNSLFYNLGKLAVGFSLLGLVIDRPISVALLSVATGVGVGVSLGLVGLAFRVNATFWEWLEKSWINTYFSSYSLEMQESSQPSETTKNDLEGLKAWGKIKNLKVIKEKVIQVLNSLEHIRDLSNLENKQNLMQLIELLALKIDNFNQTCESIRLHEGGEEVLAFLESL